MAKINKLYIAKEVQYFDGFPFLKIKVLRVEKNVVHFSTEWPIRELACKMIDFNTIFKEW